jgi:hypothetical protein
MPIFAPPTIFDAPYVGWDAVNIGSGVTLSSGIATNSKIAHTTSGAWNSARSAVGRSSGKWYAEIILETFSPTTGNEGQIFGFGDGTFGLNNFAGAAANSIGARNSSTQVTGWTRNIATLPGGSAAANDVWMLAADIDNSALRIGLNGTFLFSGNPATGANKWGTPNTTPIFVLGGMFDTLPTMELRTLFRQMSFTPPAGFAPWAGG